jgi:hypothetical protein
MFESRLISAAGIWELIVVYSNFFILVQAMRALMTVDVKLVRISVEI